MKKTFAKLLLTVLVLAITLTGCNLIAIDPDMQADEDIAKIDKAYAATVATYSDKTVTAADVMAEFNSNYNQMYYIYAYYYGYEMTEDDVQTLMEDTLTERVQANIIAEHYDATEGAALTDEKVAECESNAQTNYDETYASVLEQATGDDDTAKAANARVTMAQLGYSYDSMLASELRTAKGEAMEELLRAEISELTDEEIQTAYDEQVASDEETYYTGSYSFENAMTGDDTTVCYIPEGYRTVKHILVIPEDEVLTAYTDAVSALDTAESTLSDLYSELAEVTDDDAEEETEETEETEEAVTRTEEEINADITAAEADITEKQAAVDAAAQACLDNVKEKTSDIYARLDAGEEFDALIAEYGEDPGMQNEPTASRGYYVCAYSSTWETNFTTAAMALENVGDYTTEPVVSGSGVHIIRYETEVTAGAVPLEDVRDALYESTLETKKDTHYEETIAAWVEEANPTYDAAALKSAIVAVGD